MVIPVMTLVTMGLAAILATNARAQCVLLQERQGPEYTPHISVHFGDLSELPGRVRCSTSIEERSGYWCIPVYAWNLWDDARNVEFAIRTPTEPTGFDRGPQISGVQMYFKTDETGTTTSFDLSSDEPLCGPTLLGCLRLSAAELPESFSISLGEHSLTQRKAVQGSSGNWRTFSVHGEGTVGGTGSCSEDACSINQPIANLNLRNGDSRGLIDLSWTPGSGTFTLLRYRLDGRYPTDPWDGEVLAFLPSNIQNLSTRVDFTGAVHVTAWSVTRGANGRLLDSSNIECGSVSSLMVHQPIAVETTQWHQMKTLYR
jgi:hypothetical protein